MQAPQRNLVTLSLSENITCPQPNTPLHMEIADSLICVRPWHLNFFFQTPDSQLHWVLCLWVFSKDIQVNWGSVAGRISPFSFLTAKFISYKTDSQGKEQMESFFGRYGFMMNNCHKQLCFRMPHRPTVTGAVCISLLHSLTCV